MWRRVVGWFVENWGAFSQLVVGLFAIVLALRPGKVTELESSKWWKIGAPIVVGFFAVTGFVQSYRSDEELRGQVRTMYARTMVEATKDDVSTLTSDIDSGFKTVLDALKVKTGKPRSGKTLGKSAEARYPLHLIPSGLRPEHCLRTLACKQFR